MERKVWVTSKLPNTIVTGRHCGRVQIKHMLRLISYLYHGLNNIYTERGNILPGT
jgi:hypothetical protein